MLINPTVRNNYFCGANATIKLDENIIAEGVTVMYTLEQNRLPLFGYNKAEFSAVADGQVIVLGKLAVNYIHHEYLLSVIRNSIIVDNTPSPKDLSKLSTWELDYLITSGSEQEITSALKEKFWNKKKDKQGEYNTNIKNSFGRPDQHSKSLTIKACYGDPNGYNYTEHTIQHVFFKGRSMNTIITEDPQIETYDFIARTIY